MVYFNFYLIRIIRSLHKNELFKFLKSAFLSDFFTKPILILESSVSFLMQIDKRNLFCSFLFLKMIKDPNAEVDIKRTEYWIGVVIKYIMSLKPCLITGLVVAVLMTLINYYRLLGRVKMQFHN